MMKIIGINLAFNLFASFETHPRGREARKPKLGTRYAVIARRIIFSQKTAAKAPDVETLLQTDGNLEAIPRAKDCASKNFFYRLLPDLAATRRGEAPPEGVIQMFFQCCCPNGVCALRTHGQALL